MKYISYWIPSTNALDFESLVNNVYSNNTTNDISDNLEDTANNLHLTFQENKNIDIQYQGNHYELKHEELHDNGILIYSYETMPEEVEEILDIQVYHHLKAFFHIHDCHDEEEDALLHAYKTESKPDFNDITEHYCSIYKKKFDYHYDNLIEVASVDIIMDSYVNKQKKVHEALKTTAEMQKRIHKIERELLYFKFLIEGLPNDTTLKNRFLIDYKNHLVKFHILYKEYEILDNQLDTEFAQIINKHQVILAILGIGLGFILGCIGWYYGYHGATGDVQLDLNNSNNQIIQKIDAYTINNPSQKIIDKIELYQNKNMNEFDVIKKELKSLNELYNSIKIKNKLQIDAKENNTTRPIKS